MPPRRCLSFWAASLLAVALLAAAPSRLLPSNAGAITTHAAAQNQGISKPVWARARAPSTRNYKTDGGWRPSARGAAGAVAFGAFWSCSALPTRGSSAARVPAPFFSASTEHRSTAVPVSDVESTPWPLGVPARALGGCAKTTLRATDAAAATAKPSAAEPGASPWGGSTRDEDARTWTTRDDDDDLAGEA